MVRNIILALLTIISFTQNNTFSQTEVRSDSTTPYFSLDTLYYELDNVVITGTRVKKRIIDIPYPVYRINNTNFVFDRKIGINEVLASVPGVFMQSRYGNHDVRISIRGFGSRSNSGIRGVRILLDGIPESEPDGQTRIEAIDFNSIGKIEIAKGNSSSLYTNPSLSRWKWSSCSHTGKFSIYQVWMVPAVNNQCKKRGVYQCS